MNDQPTTTTDWQARAEKAESELVDAKAHNVNITRRWSADVTELRAELERLKAACAEMGKALSESARELRFSPTYPRSEDQRERKRVIEQAQSALARAHDKGLTP